MRRRMPGSDLDAFDEFFRRGARRTDQDADLFFEALRGRGAPMSEQSAAHEADEVRREAVVGQPIVIDLPAALPGMIIDKVEWSIDGNAVGGYDIDVAHARVTPVDTTKSKLTLFWIAAGVARVRCKAALRVTSPPARPFEIAVDYVYDVRAPTLGHLTAKTAAPIIHDAVDRGTKRTRKELSFGDRDGVYGIHWDLELSLPRGVTGQIADVQLVKLGRRREVQFVGETATQKQRFTTAAGDRYVLDVERTGKKVDCTDMAPWYHIPAVRIAGPAYSTDFPYDVPAAELVASTKSIEIDEWFRYYVLFKPEVNGAIWVPVAKAEWFWRATADHRAAWVMRTTPKPEGAVVGGRGGATTEYPQYGANACLREWAPEGASGIRVG